ncbi:cysteine hydrolase [Acidipropionibacterium jensenii]|uniref:cysteine hydrolase family protein n=1 Tax=Acidipropionibacterium jensenii TaxID=1749 RepID=UPI00110A14AC|nr:isochorismatase family protein [Acidipropionibacterium jensenii]QCV87120.1 cysteine hydrolase [Acidipropionibacterium jensenii]
MSGSDLPWLVVIDPQRIFADPSSPWCAHDFGAVVGPIGRLSERFGDRVLVTRWLPGSEHPGAWADYFDSWSFADRPDDDPCFDLVDAARGWSRRPGLDLTTFGKWGPQLAGITGPTPHLALVGVATDCCVISTALAAADAGAWVQVVSDGCAGSTPENQAAALRLIGLYSPQIEITSSSDLLG